jgi:dihydropteroate synthase
VKESGVKFKILGILNLTPDSFSDGNEIKSQDDALQKFERLLMEGSNFIDIGAESTRPGAQELKLEDEWQRLHPVLDAVLKEGRLSQVSIDTRKPEIMKRAAKMGVAFINNVGPLPPDEDLISLFQINPNLSFIACHMHGTPENMQLNPLTPRSARKRVDSYFEGCQSDLEMAGCKKENIYLDPGIGFGKNDSANWSLLFDIPKYSSKYQIALGVSRKSFIGRAFDLDQTIKRDPITKLIEAQGARCGAAIIRTHDVLGLRRVLDIFTEAQA